MRDYNFVETNYVYQEGWQYQKIFVCVDTMTIMREQNVKRRGTILVTCDILKVGSTGWLSLFRRYGFDAINEYYKEVESEG